MARRPIPADQLLFDPTRLALMALLIRSGGQADINDIIGKLGIKCRGLLWAHGNKLAEAELIDLQRSGDEGRRNTALAITNRGRRDFARHRAVLIAMTDVHGLEVAA